MENLETKWLGKRVGNAVIVGVIDPLVYSRFYEKTPHTVWDEDYPEWREKPVFMLEYDEPVRRWTFEEWKRFAKEGMPDDVATWLYENDPNLYQDVMWVPYDSIAKKSEDNV